MRQVEAEPVAPGECVATERSMPQSTTAAVFTVAFVLFMIFFMLFWHPSLTIMSVHVHWDLWVWFVCCGVVLLLVARFFMRHSVLLPEIGLLAYPFLFGCFFQLICPSTSVASVDELLWSFDATFGYPQPSLGRLLISEPLLFWTCKVIWSSLPLLFVVMYLLLPEVVRRKYLAVLVCSACLILPLYALCPAAGPVYLFRTHYPYPNGLPMPLVHPHRTFVQPGLPLNTTPSGHVTWTLLLLWFAYKYCGKGVAVFFGLILTMTVVATLGLGEHYVIDLILSLPYAAAIWSLVERQWKRFGVLLLLVIAWLVVLREGWAIPAPAPVVWLLCAMTGLSCLRWQELRSWAFPNYAVGVERLSTFSHRLSAGPAKSRGAAVHSENGIHAANDRGCRTDT